MFCVFYGTGERRAKSYVRSVGIEGLSPLKVPIDGANPPRDNAGKGQGAIPIIAESPAYCALYKPLVCRPGLMGFCCCTYVTELGYCALYGVLDTAGFEF